MFNQHLSQISTMWTEVFEAHGGSAEAARAAQRQILLRYVPAIHAYLLAGVRDTDAADELFQEFAWRFVRGDFRRANPERGRFRDYLKAALRHLVTDHHRRQAGRRKALRQDVPDPATLEPPLADADRKFLASWLGELLGRAWEALRQFELRGGPPLHTVLRLRYEQPELPAAELAGLAAALVGRRLTAEWVYKRLHQAREKFKDFLVEAVAQALENPSSDDLTQELADLGLLPHCRTALERRFS